MTIHLSHYPINCSPFIGLRIHITFVREIIIPLGRTSLSQLLGPYGPLNRADRPGHNAIFETTGIAEPTGIQGIQIIDISLRLYDRSRPSGLRISEDPYTQDRLTLNCKSRES
jgi:hypothetical protein